MKIEEIHVREAIRIMDTYRSLLVELEPLEASIREKRDRLVSIKSEVDSLKDTAMPDEVKRERLAGIMTDYEREVNKLQEVADPYTLKFDQLRKDSNRLYGLLKGNNPGASDEQLKTALGAEVDAMKIRMRSH